MPTAERIAFLRRQLAGWSGTLNAVPPFLRRMPLDTLSREASLLCGFSVLG